MSQVTTYQGGKYVVVLSSWLHGRTCRCQYVVAMTTHEDILNDVFGAPCEEFDSRGWFSVGVNKSIRLIKLNICVFLIIKDDSKLQARQRRFPTKKFPKLELIRKFIKAINGVLQLVFRFCFSNFNGNSDKANLIKFGLIIQWTNFLDPNNVGMCYFKN